MDEKGDSCSYPGLSILMEVEDEAWNAAGLGDLEALARQSVEAAARRAGLAPDLASELGVTFSSDAAVRRLNGEWRGKDRATNILSFPMRDLEPGEAPGPMLGDLVVARETVMREAAEEDKAPSDHLRHLLVHGFLHLLGYDHDEDGRAEAMEALEVDILADLGIADPYAEPAEAAPAPNNQQAER